jgi:regulator of replication initiation timing
MRLRDNMSATAAEVQALRRRLESAQQERTRAYHERDGLKSRLNDAHYEVGRIEKTLSNGQVVETHNQMAHDEIKW